MKEGKAKRKASKLPHSAAKHRTFVKNHRLIDINKTHGTPCFFTLKPISEIEPDYFVKALKSLNRFFREEGVQYIFMLEWAKHEKAPHVHLVANIHGSTPEEVTAFTDRVIKRWLESIPKNPNTRIRQDVKPVDDAMGVFGYMAKQTADEFNARALATGEDWSVLNVTGCSRRWQKSYPDTTEISRKAGSTVKREFKKIARSRGINLSKRSRGCDAETKRAISETSPFTVSGLSRAVVKRLLINAEDSQPLKERQFLMEMRDLYRQAHELGSQKEKSEVERLLLDEGYDMRHMFPVWEAPQMNRSERYNADPVFRRACQYQKTAKELKTRKSFTVSVSSVKEC